MKNRFNKLDLSEKISILLLFLILILSPFFVIAAITQKNIKSRASEPITPITIPETPTPTEMPTNYVQITQPNGGEVLIIGNRYMITWNSNKSFARIDLQYVTSNGFSVMLAKNLNDSGSFEWQVNTLFPTEKEYKIYIYAYDIDGYMIANDQSDNFFAIVDSTSTPTLPPKPTLTPTKTPTCGNIKQACCKTIPYCNFGLTCNNGLCYPIVSPTKKPTIIPTKTPTPTPIKCGKINQVCCKTNPYCQGGLTCYKGYCRYIDVIR